MSKTPTKEVNIRNLYAELNKFGQSEEYEKAIKVANKSMFYLVGLAWVLPYNTNNPPNARYT